MIPSNILSLSQNKELPTQKHSSNFPMCNDKSYHHYYTFHEKNQMVYHPHALLAFACPICWFFPIQYLMYFEHLLLVTLLVNHTYAFSWSFTCSGWFIMLHTKWMLPVNFRIKHVIYWFAYRSKIVYNNLVGYNKLAHKRSKRIKGEDC